MPVMMIVLFAAGFASLSNLFFCKSNETSKNHANGYLFCFYLLSFFLSFMVNPKMGPFDLWMCMIGALVGVANVALMGLTAKALKNGPQGLTFAFQNVSSVFPGVLLFFLFGADFGFAFSLAKILGILLIILGLFLGANTHHVESAKGLSFKWFVFALSCFAVQVVALSLIQWRCLLFCDDNPNHWLVPFYVHPSSDVWFMPGQFGAAFLLQTLIFLSEKRRLQKTEMIYGSLGGVVNGIATCLLLLATKQATDNESSILFSCFAAATIVFCNCWAKKIYREKFNLSSNALCSVGIIVGSLS